MLRRPGSSGRRFFFGKIHESSPEKWDKAIFSSGGELDVGFGPPVVS